MDRQYYEEYYSLERHHWWFRVREKILRDQLRKVIPGNNPRILNVGAATGRTSEMLSDFGDVVSLEYDEHCCDFLRAETDIDVIQGSVLDLPFEDQQFDVVCAFDVIEHVEDDWRAMQELQRVCKYEGILCVTVPAFMQLWSHHDVVNHHYRRYRLPELLSLLLPESYELIKCTYFNTFLFPPILAFRTMSRMLAWRRNGKTAGSDFSIVPRRSLLNGLFYLIFSLERPWLFRGRFPFGVSLLVLCRNT